MRHDALIFYLRQSVQGRHHALASVSGEYAQQSVRFHPNTNGLARFRVVHDDIEHHEQHGIKPSG
jgi:hypothetical protein